MQNVPRVQTGGGDDGIHTAMSMRPNTANNPTYSSEVHGSRDSDGYLKPVGMLKDHGYQESVGMSSFLCAATDQHSLKL